MNCRYSWCLKMLSKTVFLCPFNFDVSSCSPTLGNWTYQHALPFVCFPILSVLSFSLIFCDAVSSPPFLLWVHVLNHFSCIWLFATLWTVGHQAPLTMGFSRQELWSGLPCLPSGNLLKPGIEPESLWTRAVAGTFFTTSTTFCLMWHLCNPKCHELRKLAK